jgi:glucose/arabinose dehydrogenase
MTVWLDGSRVLSYGPLIMRFAPDERAWGRPTDVRRLPDGSVLVNDELAGAAYLG